MQRQMIVLAFSGVSVQHFTQLGGRADLYVLLFGDVYLALCDFATDPTANVHQILSKSQKKCEGDRGND
jgi:hypothetical protein